MKLEIRDLAWERPVSYGAAQRFFLQFMKDERDLIFIRVSVTMTAIVLPLALVLFMLPALWVGVLALPYIGFVFLVFGGRYGLMLHATGHRPIFKREYKWMNHYIPWVLGPFLGHTPTSFAAHHMWMHHAENNMLGDQSSTLPYQRDNFLHFVHYWARFFFTSYVHVPRYLYLRGRGRIGLRLMLGELAWLGLASVAVWVNWAAALVVFIVPMLMMRWLMMAGNFAQHAFVDVDDADNAYRNSNCLINAKYNIKAYNDGYHIVHHLRPAMHWSEMPGYFQDNLDSFIEQDAIVLDGLGDNQVVWFLLMTRNYDKLARHLVDFKGRSHEEKVAFLKGRVQRTRGEIPSLFRFESEEDSLRTARKTKETVAEALALA